MRKFLKNQKGFTLIELMMVVAVIGILAAVLIPKIGGTKDSAKLAGVDSNERQVEGQVNGLIQRNHYDAAKMASSLINVLNGQDATPNVDDITNPFIPTKYGALSSGTSNAVTVVGTAVNAAALATSLDNIGLIYVQVEPAIGTITKVVITPYDNNGVAMPATTVTP